MVDLFSQLVQILSFAVFFGVLFGLVRGLFKRLG